MKKKELRKFGIIVAVVLFIWGMIFYWKGKDYWSYFIVFSIAFMFSGLFFPFLLRSVNEVWNKLTVFLGWLVTRLILIILFYFVVTPIAFIARLFGKTFLDLKFNSNVNSYWIERKTGEYNKKGYENQF